VGRPLSSGREPFTIAADVNASLPDLTEGELRELLRSQAQTVVYSYNAVMDELDRRSARRQATAQLVISVVSIVIAVVALVASVLR